MTQKYKVYINNELKIITDNWENFCSNFKLIHAGGGLVYNDDNQLLMIFRNGIWDLPKGKLEVDEDVKSCAVREVEEECGVKGLHITKELISTYHIYDLNGQKVLKCTSWFKMRTSFKGILKPQSSEGITKACWVNQEDIIKRLNNSFENIKQLFNHELY